MTFVGDDLAGVLLALVVVAGVTTGGAALVSDEASASVQALDWAVEGGTVSLGPDEEVTDIRFDFVESWVSWENLPDEPTEVEAEFQASNPPDADEEWATVGVQRVDASAFDASPDEGEVEVGTSEANGLISETEWESSHFDPAQGEEVTREVEYRLTVTIYDESGEAMVEETFDHPTVQYTVERAEGSNATSSGGSSGGDSEGNDAAPDPSMGYTATVDTWPIVDGGSAQWDY